MKGGRLLDDFGGLDVVEVGEFLFEVGVAFGLDAALVGLVPRFTVDLLPDFHAFLADKAEGARVADVPNYVTESAYAEIKPARTKVGDAQEPLNTLHHQK